MIATTLDLTPRGRYFAAITPAEILQLAFPAVQVIGKFMHPNDGCALAGFFVVKAYSVGIGVGHGFSCVRVK